MTTLTIQSDNTYSRSTGIIVSNPDTNFGTATTFPVGKWGAAERGLVKFDLSSIPSNATINSATMTLYVSAVYASINPTLSAYRVKRAWGETTATWNKYDGTNAWGTAGCGNTTSDRDSTAIGTCLSQSTDGAGHAMDFALTASLVKEWVDGTLTNNGMVIISSDETTSSSERTIHSTRAATTTYRCKLVVDYSPGPPTNLVMTSAQGLRQTLTWTKATEATGYKVYGGTSANPTTLLDTLSDVDSYERTEASYGIYYYRMKAIYSGGDSAYTADVRKVTSFIDNPWTKSGGNPKFSPRLMETAFAQTAGTEISALGFTKTAKWAGSHIDTVTGGTKAALHGAGATAYMRDAEYNRGDVACARFRYTTSTGSLNTPVAVGINCSEDGSGLDGFVASLQKQAGANSYVLSIDRYTNGTGANLWQSSAATLAPNTDYVLSFGHRGHSHETAMGFAVYLYTADWATAVKTLFGNAADYTYTDGKTLLYIGETDVTVNTFDNGADGWLARFMRPILNDGDWASPRQDSQGYFWSVYESGDAASTDKISIARSTTAEGFADAGRIYDGVAPRVGPILQTAVQTGGNWPDATIGGWDSADTQCPWVIYDTDDDIYKMWYTAHNGHDFYRIGYAAASPDANGAPPTTPAGWTKYTGNPLNLSHTSGTYQTGDMEYYPAVIKKSVTHGGTAYAYQMVYMGGTSTDVAAQAMFLAYSNNGTTWTRYGEVLTMTGETLVQVTSLMYDEECSLWRVIADVAPTCTLNGSRPRSYTSPDLYTWTLEADNFLPKGTAGQWDVITSADVVFALTRLGVTGYYLGSDNANFLSAKTGTASVVYFPPAAPTSVIATLDGNHVDLAWTDNSDVETAYRVHRSVDGGSFTQLGSDLSASTVALVDSSLPSYSSLRYTVTAIGDGVDSAAVASNIIFHPFDASAAGLSAAVAEIVRVYGLTASSAGASTAAATVAPLISAAAQSAGTSGASAVMGAVYGALSEAHGQAAAVAALAATVTLDAASAGSSGATASVQSATANTWDGIANSAGQATATAVLAEVFALVAQSAGAAHSESVIATVTAGVYEGIAASHGAATATAVIAAIVELLAQSGGQGRAVASFVAEARFRPYRVTTASDRPRVTTTSNRPKVR